MKWRFPNITFMYIHKLISFFIIIIIIWIIITTCFKLFKMATGITLPLHTKYLWTLILWDLKNNQEINPGQLFSRDLCENRHIYPDNGNFAQLFSVFKNCHQWYYLVLSHPFLLYVKSERLTLNTNTNGLLPIQNHHMGKFLWLRSSNSEHFVTFRKRLW